MVVAYIGLGSNVGDRKNNITKALQLIENCGKIRILKKSSLIETKPVGPKQRSFINAAIKIETGISAEKLLYALKNIEKVMGRTRAKRWGPRIIDLDILFFGKNIIREKILTVPHKELERRSFVLGPLSEISPRLIHPIFKETVTKLKNKLNSQEI